MASWIRWLPWVLVLISFAGMKGVLGDWSASDRSSRKMPDWYTMYRNTLSDLLIAEDKLAGESKMRKSTTESPQSPRVIQARVEALMKIVCSDNSTRFAKLCDLLKGVEEPLLTTPLPKPSESNGRKGATAQQADSQREKVEGKPDALQFNGTEEVDFPIDPADYPEVIPSDKRRKITKVKVTGVRRKAPKLRDYSKKKMIMERKTSPVAMFPPSVLIRRENGLVTVTDQKGQKTVYTEEVDEPPAPPPVGKPQVLQQVTVQVDQEPDSPVTDPTAYSPVSGISFSDPPDGSKPIAVDEVSYEETTTTKPSSMRYRPVDGTGTTKIKHVRYAEKNPRWRARVLKTTTPGSASGSASGVVGYSGTRQETETDERDSTSQDYSGSVREERKDGLHFSNDTFTRDYAGEDYTEEDDVETHPERPVGIGYRNESFYQETEEQPRVNEVGSIIKGTGVQYSDGRARKGKSAYGYTEMSSLGKSTRGRQQPVVTVAPPVVMVLPAVQLGVHFLNDSFPRGGISEEEAEERGEPARDVRQGSDNHRATSIANFLENAKVDFGAPTKIKRVRVHTKSPKRERLRQYSPAPQNSSTSLSSTQSTATSKDESVERDYAAEGYVEGNAVTLKGVVGITGESSEREYEEEDYSDDDGGEPEVAVPPPAADSWLAEQHGGIHFLNDSFSREMVPEDEESADVQSEGPEVGQTVRFSDSSASSRAELAESDGSTKIKRVRLVKKDPNSIRLRQYSPAPSFPSITFASTEPSSHLKHENAERDYSSEDYSEGEPHQQKMVTVDYSEEVTKKKTEKLKEVLAEAERLVAAGIKFTNVSLQRGINEEDYAEKDVKAGQRGGFSRENPAAQKVPSNVTLSREEGSPRVSTGSDAHIPDKYIPQEAEKKTEEYNQTGKDGRSAKALNTSLPGIKASDEPQSRGTLGTEDYSEETPSRPVVPGRVGPLQKPTPVHSIKSGIRVSDESLSRGLLSSEDYQDQPESTMTMESSANKVDKTVSQVVPIQGQASEQKARTVVSKPGVRYTDESFRRADTAEDYSEGLSVQNASRSWQPGVKWSLPVVATSTTVQQGIRFLNDSFSGDFILPEDEEENRDQKVVVSAAQLYLEKSISSQKKPAEGVHVNDVLPPRASLPVEDYPELSVTGKRNVSKSPGNSSGTYQQRHGIQHNDISSHREISTDYSELTPHTSVRKHGPGRARQTDRKNISVSVDELPSTLHLQKKLAADSSAASKRVHVDDIQSHREVGDDYSEIIQADKKQEIVAESPHAESSMAITGTSKAGVRRTGDAVTRAEEHPLPGPPTPSSSSRPDHESLAQPHATPAPQPPNGIHFLNISFPRGSHLVEEDEKEEKDVDSAPKSTFPFTGSTYPVNVSVHIAQPSNRAESIRFTDEKLPQLVVDVDYTEVNRLLPKGGRVHANVLLASTSSARSEDYPETALTDKAISTESEISAQTTGSRPVHGTGSSSKAVHYSDLSSPRDTAAQDYSEQGPANPWVTSEKRNQVAPSTGQIQPVISAGHASIWFGDDRSPRSEEPDEFQESSTPPSFDQSPSTITNSSRASQKIATSIVSATDDVEKSPSKKLSRLHMDDIPSPRDTFMDDHSEKALVNISMSTGERGQVASAASRQKSVSVKGIRYSDERSSRADGVEEQPEDVPSASVVGGGSWKGGQKVEMDVSLSTEELDKKEALAAKRVHYVDTPVHRKPSVIEDYSDIGSDKSLAAASIAGLPVAAKVTSAPGGVHHTDDGMPHVVFSNDYPEMVFKKNLSAFLPTQLTTRQQKVIPWVKGVHISDVPAPQSPALSEDYPEPPMVQKETATHGAAAVPVRPDSKAPSTEELDKKEAVAAKRLHYADTPVHRKPSASEDYTDIGSDKSLAAAPISATTSPFTPQLVRPVNTQQAVRFTDDERQRSVLSEDYPETAVSKGKLPSAAVPPGEEHVQPAPSTEIPRKLHVSDVPVYRHVAVDYPEAAAPPSRAMGVSRSQAAAKGIHYSNITAGGDRLSGDDSGESAVIRTVSTPQTKQVAPSAIVKQAQPVKGVRYSDVSISRSEDLTDDHDQAALSRITPSTSAAVPGSRAAQKAELDVASSKDDMEKKQASQSSRLHYHDLPSHRDAFSEDYGEQVVINRSRPVSKTEHEEYASVQPTPAALNGIRYTDERASRAEDLQDYREDSMASLASAAVKTPGGRSKAGQKVALDVASVTADPVALMMELHYTDVPIHREPTDSVDYLDTSPTSPSMARTMAGGRPVTWVVPTRGISVFDEASPRRVLGSADYPEAAIITLPSRVPRIGQSEPSRRKPVSPVGGQMVPPATTGIHVNDESNSRSYFAPEDDTPKIIASAPSSLPGAAEVTFAPVGDDGVANAAPMTEDVNSSRASQRIATSIVSATDDVEKSPSKKPSRLHMDDILSPRDTFMDDHSEKALVNISMSTGERGQVASAASPQKSVSVKGIRYSDERSSRADGVEEQPEDIPSASVVGGGSWKGGQKVEMDVSLSTEELDKKEAVAAKRVHYVDTPVHRKPFASEDYTDIVPDKSSIAAASIAGSPVAAEVTSALVGVHQTDDGMPHVVFSDDYPEMVFKRNLSAFLPTQLTTRQQKVIPGVKGVHITDVPAPRSPILSEDYPEPPMVQKETATHGAASVPVRPDSKASSQKAGGIHVDEVPSHRGIPDDYVDVDHRTAQVKRKSDVTIVRTGVAQASSGVLLTDVPARHEISADYADGPSRPAESNKKAPTIVSAVPSRRVHVDDVSSHREGSVDYPEALVAIKSETVVEQKKEIRPPGVHYSNVSLHRTRSEDYAEVSPAVLTDGDSALKVDVLPDARPAEKGPSIHVGDLPAYREVSTDYVESLLSAAGALVPPAKTVMVGEGSLVGNISLSRSSSGSVHYQQEAQSRGTEDIEDYLEVSQGHVTTQTPTTKPAVIIEQHKTGSQRVEIDAVLSAEDERTVKRPVHRIPYSNDSMHEEVRSPQSRPATAQPVAPSSTGYPTVSPRPQSQVTSGRIHYSNVSVSRDSAPSEDYPEGDGIGQVAIVNQTIASGNVVLGGQKGLHYGENDTASEDPPEVISPAQLAQVSQEYKAQTENQSVAFMAEYALPPPSLLPVHRLHYSNLSVDRETALGAQDYSEVEVAKVAPPAPFTFGPVVISKARKDVQQGIRQNDTLHHRPVFTEDYPEGATLSELPRTVRTNNSVAASAPQAVPQALNRLRTDDVPVHRVSNSEDYDEVQMALQQQQLARQNHSLSAMTAVNVRGIRYGNVSFDRQLSLEEGYYEETGEESRMVPVTKANPPPGIRHGDRNQTFPARRVHYANASITRDHAAAAEDYFDNLPSIPEPQLLLPSRQPIIQHIRYTNESFLRSLDRAEDYPELTGQSPRDASGQTRVSVPEVNGRWTPNRALGAPSGVLLVHPPGSGWKDAAGPGPEEYDEALLVRSNASLMAMRPWIDGKNAWLFHPLSNVQSVGGDTSAYYFSPLPPPPPPDIVATLPSTTTPETIEIVTETIFPLDYDEATMRTTTVMPEAPRTPLPVQPARLLDRVVSVQADLGGKPIVIVQSVQGIERQAGRKDVYLDESANVHAYLHSPALFPEIARRRPEVYAVDVEQETTTEKRHAFPVLGRAKPYRSPNAYGVERDNRHEDDVTDDAGGLHVPVVERYISDKDQKHATSTTVPPSTTTLPCKNETKEGKKAAATKDNDDDITVTKDEEEDATEETLRKPRLSYSEVSYGTEHRAEDDYPDVSQVNKTDQKAPSTTTTSTTTEDSLKKPRLSYSGVRYGTGRVVVEDYPDADAVQKSPARTEAKEVTTTVAPGSMKRGRLSYGDVPYGKDPFLDQDYSNAEAITTPTTTPTTAPTTAPTTTTTTQRPISSTPKVASIKIHYTNDSMDVDGMGMEDYDERRNISQTGSQGPIEVTPVNLQPGPFPLPAMQYPLYRQPVQYQPIPLLPVQGAAVPGQGVRLRYEEGVGKPLQDDREDYGEGQRSTVPGRYYMSMQQGLPPRGGVGVTGALRGDGFGDYDEKRMSTVPMEVTESSVEEDRPTADPTARTKKYMVSSKERVAAVLGLAKLPSPYRWRSEPYSPAPPAQAPRRIGYRYRWRKTATSPQPPQPQPDQPLLPPISYHPPPELQHQYPQATPQYPQAPSSPPPPPPTQRVRPVGYRWRDKQSKPVSPPPPPQPAMQPPGQSWPQPAPNTPFRHGYPWSNTQRPPPLPVVPFEPVPDWRLPVVAPPSNFFTGRRWGKPLLERTAWTLTSRAEYPYTTPMSTQNEGKSPLEVNELHVTKLATTTKHDCMYRECQNAKASKTAEYSTPASSGRKVSAYSVSSFNATNGLRRIFGDDHNNTMSVKEETVMYPKKAVTEEPMVVRTVTPSTGGATKATGEITLKQVSRKEDHDEDPNDRSDKDWAIIASVLVNRTKADLQNSSSHEKGQALRRICTPAMRVEDQSLTQTVDCSQYDLSELPLPIVVSLGSGSFNYEIVTLNQGGQHQDKFSVDESNGHLYATAPFTNSNCPSRDFLCPNTAYNVVVRVYDDMCDFSEQAVVSVVFRCHA